MTFMKDILKEINGNKTAVDKRHAKLPSMKRVKDRFLRNKHFKNTINSEIFVRVLFSRNFAYAWFRENKILPK